MIRVHVLNVGHGDCIVVEFPGGRLPVALASSFSRKHCCFDYRAGSSR